MISVADDLSPIRKNAVDCLPGGVERQVLRSLDQASNDRDGAHTCRSARANTAPGRIIDQLI